MPYLLTAMREHALQIFSAAVKAVQPQYLLPEYIRWKQDKLWLGNKSFHRDSFNNIYVTGAGKASAAMARQAELILGEHITGGVVVTKYNHGFPLQKIYCIEAGHPVPDENSLQAGNEIVQLLKDAGENDLIIALISGGASALMADLPPGVSLQELQQLFNGLLHSGATIQEINTVRKHLSPGIKGGQLARTAFPATIHSFILSDVIGDALESIASGPTVPDSSTFAESLSLLEKYRLIAGLPAGIRQWLQQGMNGVINETPKPGDPVFGKSDNYLIGTNRLALQAAVEEATKLNYKTLILSDALVGEARDKATELVQQVMKYNGERPACLLLGGETTVTIKGSGKGGRNQEFVLAALTEIQRLKITAENMPVILSAGTDGTDGPTDAAGAVSDGPLAEAVQTLSLNAREYLEQNDSYHFFKQAGGHVITGPTQTNVMDIVVVLMK